MSKARSIDLGRWLRAMRRKPQPEGLDPRSVDERIRDNAEALEIARSRHETTPAQVPSNRKPAEVKRIRKDGAA